MGLDMYLSAKKYVNKHEYGATTWEDRQVTPEFENVIASSGLRDFCADDSVNIYGANVSVTCAYWRKANQIHQWFVNNCQDGVDECQEVYVSPESLEELRGICNEVLASKGDTSIAEELLPPASGFFFGSEEYDEWYYQDIQYTADRLKAILQMYEEAKKNDNYVSFTYQSSW